MLVEFILSIKAGEFMATKNVDNKMMLAFIRNPVRILLK
jgi:hypothetical protein